MSTKSDSSRSTPSKSVESTATTSTQGPTEKIVNAADKKAAEEEDVVKKVADEIVDMMTPCRSVLLHQTLSSSP